MQRTVYEIDFDGHIDTSATRARHAHSFDELAVASLAVFEQEDDAHAWELVETRSRFDLVHQKRRPIEIGAIDERFLALALNLDIVNRPLRIACDDIELRRSPIDIAIDDLRANFFDDDRLIAGYVAQ